MNTRRSMGVVTAAAMALILVPQAAVAEERNCRGRIGSKTVDNLKVPSGAKCVLQGTKVKGTIKVEGNGVLRAENVNVIGNVQGENARMVKVIDGSRVGGSVQVVQGERAVVRGSKVNADILYDDQTGRAKSKNNEIGGNLQAFQNTGGVRIVKNRIDGNLQCKENDPRPTGFGNTVQGSKEDQCKKL